VEHRFSDCEFLELVVFNVLLLTLVALVRVQEDPLRRHAPVLAVGLSPRVLARVQALLRPLRRQEFHLLMVQILCLGHRRWNLRASQSRHLRHSVRQQAIGENHRSRVGRSVRHYHHTVHSLGVAARALYLISAQHCVRLGCRQEVDLVQMALDVPLGLLSAFRVVHLVTNVDRVLVVAVGHDTISQARWRQRNWSVVLLDPIAAD